MFLGDTAGRRGARASLLGPPTRSPTGEEAYGSCRTCGKRRSAFPTRSLDGAQTAPPTTLHRPSAFPVFRMKNEEHKITALLDARRKEIETAIFLVASLR
jgi:hypothetical protein